MDEQTTLTPASRWILKKYFELENSLQANLETYEIAHNIDSLYRFVWDYYADWYVEYLKTDNSQVDFAKELFKQFVIVLSPYAPFETEALWKEFFTEEDLLALHLKPEFSYSQSQTQGWEEFAKITESIIKVRSLRGLFGIDPATIMEIFTENEELLKYSQFLRLSAKCKTSKGSYPTLFKIVSAGYEFYIDILRYVPDKKKEIARTNKNIQNLDKQINSLKKQLQNSSFLQNASQEVINQKQSDLSDRQTEKLEQESKLDFLIA